jgi:hypothetical protein
MVALGSEKNVVVTWSGIRTHVGFVTGHREGVTNILTSLNLLICVFLGLKHVKIDCLIFLDLGQFTRRLISSYVYGFTPKMRPCPLMFRTCRRPCHRSQEEPN